MKAMAKISNLKGDKGKHIIIRNLKQILDIRILDVDVENGRLVFLYQNPLTFQKVKQELRRIGYPMKSCTYTGKKDAKSYRDKGNDFKNVLV